jgi:pimeloyl-ACP methyl ester carboxylesterase
MTQLDVRNAIHVGHSTGGGEVTRYIGRHGTGRVAKAVLVSAIPPLMLKTEANPGGTPIEAFDKLREGVRTERTQFWRELSYPFYGYNRPGAKVSEGVQEQFVHQCMMAGFPASYFSKRGRREPPRLRRRRKRSAGIARVCCIRRQRVYTSFPTGPLRRENGSGMLDLSRGTRQNPPDA